MDHCSFLILKQRRTGLVPDGHICFSVGSMPLGNHAELFPLLRLCCGVPSMLRGQTTHAQAWSRVWAESARQLCVRSFLRACMLANKMWIIDRWIPTIYPKRVFVSTASCRFRMLPIFQKETITTTEATFTTTRSFSYSTESISQDSEVQLFIYSHSSISPNYNIDKCISRLNNYSFWVYLIKKLILKMLIAPIVRNSKIWMSSLWNGSSNHGC